MSWDRYKIKFRHNNSTAMTDSSESATLKIVLLNNSIIKKNIGGYYETDEEIPFVAVGVYDYA